MKPWIITSFEHPPFPASPFWRAWDDRLGADASPYGQGATEQEAIDDLLWHLEFLGLLDEPQAEGRA